MMDKGLRVLCFACSEEPEKDVVFVGLIWLEDPPRPEVKEATQKCHEAGIRIILITGDASRTALAIAKEIELVRGNPLIIEAEEFHKMRACFFLFPIDNLMYQLCIIKHDKIS